MGAKALKTHRYCVGFHYMGLKRDRASGKQHHLSPSYLREKQLFLYKSHPINTHVS